MTDYSKISDPHNWPWTNQVCSGDLLTVEQSKRMDLDRLSNMGYGLRRARGGKFRVVSEVRA